MCAHVVTVLIIPISLFSICLPLSHTHTELNVILLNHLRVSKCLCTCVNWQTLRLKKQVDGFHKPQHLVLAGGEFETCSF